MSDEQRISNIEASLRQLWNAQVLMHSAIEEQQLRTARSFEEMQKAIHELTASVKVTDANVAALATMHRERMEGKNGGS